MTVFLNGARKAVVVSYNNVGGDTVEIRATNATDDHAHASGPHPNKPDANGTGNIVLTYPASFQGTSHVEITGSDGSREEGDVSIS